MAAIWRLLFDKLLFLMIIYGFTVPVPAFYAVNRVRAGA